MAAVEYPLRPRAVIGTRERFHITTAQTVETSSKPRDGIPASVSGDDWFYWTPTWRENVRRAHEDLAAGRYRQFTDLDEMDRWLAGE
jgi:hypothetical protein